MVSLRLSIRGKRLPILGERAVAFPRLRHAEPPAVKMIGYVVKSATAPTP